MQSENSTSSEKDEVEKSQGETFPATGHFVVNVSELQVGGYVNVKDQPHQITEINTKRGKHGLGFIIKAVDLFAGTETEFRHLKIANLDIPYVLEKDFSLMEASDNSMTLKDTDGNLRTDVPIPDDEYGREIQEKLNSKSSQETIMVTLLSAIGRSKVVAVKSVQN